MNLVQMPVNSIIIPDRKRQADPAKVKSLADSIKLVGLLQPVILKADGTLAAGLHRFEAHKLLKRATIPAIIAADDMDALQAELAEIDENLIRNELTPLQQGEWLNRRDEVLKAMGVRANVGGQIGNSNAAKNEGDTVSPSFKTTADIAAEVGISERSAQRKKQIARDIAPEVKEKIYGTELEQSTSKLLQIARMELPQQMKTVDELLSPLHLTDQSGGKLSQPMQVMLSHKSVEYYTPAEIIEAARAVMGGISLDPASCAEANAIVKADNYFTIHDDGINKQWYGRVWLNPPYAKTNGKSNQELWALKLLDEYASSNIEAGLLLVKSALGYKWFEQLWDIAPVCFLRERLSFTKSDGSSDGQSKHGTAIFYVGRNQDNFIEVFSRYGRITSPAGQYIQARQQ